jgi:hypothetical protein
LMTADGRLVYYGIRVNDVYQRFSDKFNSMQPQPTKFPSSLAEDGIDNTLPDAKALVIEIKTSWIDVCKGISYNNCGAERKKYDDTYLTLDAQIIPTYVPPSSSNNSILLKGPNKKTTLALLGMHVAFTANGSPKGFPGMLWSTFEQVNNARNVAYSYDPLEQQPPKPFDGDGDWLLAGNATSCSKDNVDAKKANIPRMNMDGQNIVRANKMTTIGPSDVCRISPWGNFEGTGSQNAGIISINASLWEAFKTYAPTDVRKNYMLLGTTWMINEAMPPEHNSGHQGTHSLANSTMETFQQGKDNNCLTCHRDGDPKAPLLNVSHIWKQSHPSRSDTYRRER